MRVDDIDPNGKVSPHADRSTATRATRRAAAATVGVAERPVSAPARRRRARHRRRVVSFEDASTPRPARQFGDLGPAEAASAVGRRPRERRRRRPRPRSAPQRRAAGGEPPSLSAPHRDAPPWPPGSASSPSACPRRARSRAASGSASAPVTSPTSWPASRTSSSTCCSRAPTTARAREIAEAIDRVGGDMNAFTTKEYTAYYTRLPARARRPRPRAARRRAHARRRCATTTSRASARSSSKSSLMDEDTPEDESTPCCASRCSRTTRSGGRRPAARRRSRRSAPTTSARFFAARYRTAAMVVAGGRAARPRPRRRRGRARASAGAGAATAAPRAAAHRAQSCRSPCCAGRPSRPTSRSASAAARRAPTPTARRSTCSTTCSAGACRAACSRDPRGAGLAYAVYSAPPVYSDAGALDDLRRHDAGAGRRGARAHRRRARPARRRRHHRRRARRRHGYLEGSFVLGLEDSGSRMARLGGSLTVRGHVRTVDEQLERLPRGHPRRRAPGRDRGARGRGRSRPSARWPSARSPIVSPAPPDRSADGSDDRRRLAHVAIPQHPLVELPRRKPRQLGLEVDRARHLEAGERARGVTR